MPSSPRSIKIFNVHVHLLFKWPIYSCQMAVQILSHTEPQFSIYVSWIRVRIELLVFKATFNNIIVISWQSAFLLWRIQEFLWKKPSCLTLYNYCQILSHILVCTGIQCMYMYRIWLYLIGTGYGIYIVGWGKSIYMYHIYNYFTYFVPVLL